MDEDKKRCRDFSQLLGKYLARNVTVSKVKAPKLEVRREAGWVLEGLVGVEFYSQGATNATCRLCTLHKEQRDCMMCVVM